MGTSTALKEILWISIYNFITKFLTMRKRRPISIFYYSYERKALRVQRV